MYRFYFKRFFDFVFALVLSPAFLVILFIVGPLIYLEDKGSIFYNSFRLGKNGKIYTMYKFRTMKMNAPDIRNIDGSTFNSEDDPRLTKVGKYLRKTSLDEIPQLINVIRGDMSIIGPRPDLPEHMEMYSKYEARKLELRPGITGYNQAYYRNTIPWKDRITNDIYYIDHLSLWIDSKIFQKTVVSVLKREDIFLRSEINNKELM